MIQNNDYLEIVGDFLIRFYHEEPDDFQASIKAIRNMTGIFDYEWQLATAFKFVLQENFDVGVLRNLVRIKANRHAQNDEDARHFLENIYQNIGLDNAINFDDYES